MLASSKYRWRSRTFQSIILCHSCPRRYVRTKNCSLYINVHSIDCAKLWHKTIAINNNVNMHHAHDHSHCLPSAISNNKHIMTQACIHPIGFEINSPGSGNRKPKKKIKRAPPLQSFSPLPPSTSRSIFLG